MQEPSHPPIAIVADAHFHDVDGDYGIAGVGADNRRLTLRPLDETAKSTRVFNESSRALRHSLDDIAVRGIRHVVLLGDYSDDGQRTTLGSLRALLEEYRIRFGMRFIATPGNHDLWGPAGRQRTKRFLATEGRYEVISSDPLVQNATVISDGMRGVGYDEGLSFLADAGFFASSDDLHWETPFGTDDDLDHRKYTARSPDGATRRKITDASYLIEPFDGVWLLMIDANVFVPIDGAAGDNEHAFADSSNAGWNAMLVHKRFAIDWIADVAARAKQRGKTLIAFSHYPALDPLDGTAEQERRLIGDTSLLKRIPRPDVGAALIASGIHVHFSGHLHINDTAAMRTPDGFLVNVAVPALVAFPAGYKILTIEAERLKIETIVIGGMELDGDILEQYRLETIGSGLGSSGMLADGTYGAFLAAHLDHLVRRRYLKREWPVDLIDAADRLTLAEIAGTAGPGGVFSGISAMTLVADWYRARMASAPLMAEIPGSRREIYRMLAELEGHAEEADSVAARFAQLSRMIEHFLSGMPSHYFSIDLTSGDVDPL